MGKECNQSTAIDVLRLPLAIMVVFIHISPKVFCISDCQYPIFTGRGLLNFVEILCSNVISHIAVPTFFFISGLLFFLNIQTWSWSKYLTKIKSRFNTIVIPYMLWNFTSFTLVAIAILISDFRHGGGG